MRMSAQTPAEVERAAVLRLLYATVELWEGRGSGSAAIALSLVAGAIERGEHLQNPKGESP